ncbi:tripartite tricarboxylate transporter TctB family protein [Sinorhizobium medicae]|uniref:Putative tricarboxylic transport membrane protein n=1 Tax=Sinorhizobium medicae TaxID=110321 RepID=A0A508X3C4_9HYPH|nr:tripartite tricarboxylate transporter TctB family protein [Sinorhizobium medicae]MDX0422400.1 tripartite tricarboxylate transporter TctB family protein [Sinorhizobium medicae]MDX0519965.1 tripartite tricarboxylate transporter TctB family protein [Sinorhizobium medicae]MDX0544763.1 tripartite tricarboxylate transporter TctB family protein [Sinorhizobium medicae]MDX0631576.1 tripartite tricarboxylate transporter TctB family protein [Sinorhizobium medicae]MDX0711169.1 tripartite tricarboxylate
MTQKTLRIPNRPTAMIAVVLFAIAFITYWDASHMKVRATYGMSASAASYFVAILFVVLAIGHLISAFKPSDIEVEGADWMAVGWIGFALAGLIGSIWLGGGFIPGSTLLFALTARAFGRKALLVDLCLGAVIGVFVFLLFNKLLTLALPQGPLERLF